MRGVVFDGARVEVVDDLEIRDPGPGEVLVAVAAAGLCHSDLSVIDGTIPFPPPVVLGHEGAGVVEAVGAGVEHVAPPAAPGLEKAREVIDEAADKLAFAAHFVGMKGPGGGAAPSAQ